MDKISGIIPGSARVTAVDLKEASPVRPGTPSFGRPEGVSSLKEAAKLAAIQNAGSNLGQNFGQNIGSNVGTSQKALAAHTEMAGWRAKDAKNAALAAELSERFFIRNQKSVEPTNTSINSQINNFETQSNLPAFRISERETVSNPAGFKTDEGGSLLAAMRTSGSFPSVQEESYEESYSEPDMPLQPEGLYPKGSFIDRSA